MSKILVIAESSGPHLTTSTLEVCQAAFNLATSIKGSWSILVDERAANAAVRIAPDVISCPLGEGEAQSPELWASIVMKAPGAADLLLI
ncbi:MAG: hypothetical protein OXF48_08390, partial [Bacteroidetes bacterium]|nr:hypothetical protein [Bacteroidota bacterium]